MSEAKQTAQVETRGRITVTVTRKAASFKFNIKMHSPLKKLMIRYCEILGLSKIKIIFKFNDQVIKENDTPSSLDMKEGDVIIVRHRKRSGRITV